MNLEYIDGLLRGEGRITLGRIYGIPCAAIASDGASSLAMLVRGREETLGDLLQRLDAAIESAVEHDELIDEING